MMKLNNVTKKNIQIGPLVLEGFLAVPDRALGLVIFAHGSGSSRHSPRNTRVAEQMNARGLATLLFDLLAPQEAEVRPNVFDIGLLGTRVEAAIRWAQESDAVRNLPVGLFGASTGAAAALSAAAHMPGAIAAVVSRGGRPDLAGRILPRVRAPTLLIVGGADHGVIELNEQAFEALTCEKRLDIVPGATHLFEETGTLDQVVRRAVLWFETYFRRKAP